MAKWLALVAIFVLMLTLTSWEETTATPKPGALRVVSLSPSNTELIYSLKAENLLVGRCNQCDYPPQCLSIPVMGSFTSANLEKLARIRPHLIFTVSGQESVSSTLKHLRFRVTELNNNKLSRISANLRILGNLTGNDNRAQELAAGFDKSLADFSAIIASSHSRPRIFYCVWPNPLLTVGSGSFLNDCITICGATNIAAGIKNPYPHYSLETLLVQNPDVIVLPYEARVQHLETRSPWNSLKAFRDKKVFYLPDAKSDMLARPTLRITRGLSWLASLLHPELAPRLTEWQKSAALSNRV